MRTVSEISLLTQVLTNTKGTGADTAVTDMREDSHCSSASDFSTGTFKKLLVHISVQQSFKD